MELEYWEAAKAFLLTEGTEVGIALIKAALLLFVGLKVIKWLSNMFRKMMDRKFVDPSLRPFLSSLFYNTLLVMLILSVLATLGIQMTSFVAIIGAAGLAIGLALQGTLANFAGGVIILTIKPFIKGDFIQAGSHSGTVQEIQIFNTILTTPDNKRIIIPNGKLSNDSIVNYSAEDLRRVDMVFGISYEDDVRKAKKILTDIILADERVLTEPAPNISVNELADSSVNFIVRPWVKREDYWSLYWDMQERIKLAFDENDITIPYPQRDVHMHQS